METSAQYREFAEQCVWLAEFQTETERHRRILKEMAEAWKELADEVDRKGRYYSGSLSSTSFGVFRVFRRQTEPDLRHVQQHWLCLIIFRSLRYFQALFGKTLILIRL
jgi:hypothetical protein